MLGPKIDFPKIDEALYSSGDMAAIGKCPGRRGLLSIAQRCFFPVLGEEMAGILVFFNVTVRHSCHIKVCSVIHQNLIL